jgi:GT2 family glycosyltransferase
MKVYVIIVSYNGMKWIDQCLSSLLKSNIDIQIIVVDNASTDRTPAFIKENYKTVVLLEQSKNIGFGKANNIGLKMALEGKCDFSFLLNQDAFVAPETIEILIKASEKNPEFGIISPIHLNGAGTYLDTSFLYYIKNGGNSDFLNDSILNKDKQDLYDYRMINAAAWLLPVGTLKTVGGFSPIFFLYGEDDNYCQRVYYHGLKIGISPSTMIRHDSENNIHAEIVKGSKRYYDIFLNRIKIKYANVNTNDYKQLNMLKNYQLKKAVKSLLKGNVEDFQINMKKRRLIKDLDFTLDIVEGRKKKANYL